MARQEVDIGVQGNDGTGDSIRSSFRKINDNFQELYAVFGIGGQISFTDLNDTPDTYDGNENKIPSVRSDGTGINLLDLASDKDLDGSPDTIGFDFSVDGKLVIKQLSSRLANDPEPTLAGPLNAATQPIAGVSVSNEAIDIFNSVYGTDYTVGDLVINKSFADSNYQEKQVAGGGIRLEDEPSTTDKYTLTATGISIGNLVIPDHGLSDAFNGAEFIFRSTGDAPAGVTNEESVYTRIVDNNTISLYTSQDNAISNQNKILLNGGSGTFTITDAAYDKDLTGNWLSNVAMPRRSVVRRQGDTLEGALNLHDHPGELSGTGLPNGPDDLQAASKLYVDNASASSQINLYVSNAGSDRQQFTPDGKEGRAPGYAYKTINAAAQKAEEIIEAAPYEPGPYMQTMTFNNGSSAASIVSAGINSPISARTNARDLIVQNKEFIAKEVTGYIDSKYSNFSDTYDKSLCQRDVEYILESASLDALLGNNANYLSRWAGMRYFSSVSSQKAIGAQRVQTIDGIEYAKQLVTQYILTNTQVETVYQDRVEQYINTNVIPDSNAANAIGAKFDIVVDIIKTGVLNAPSIVDGQTTYKINVSNGNFGFIDQANPENTDIIPGKVVRGRRSGALGQIIDYKYEAGNRSVSVPTTDEIEVRLLKPITFYDNEELEYGNIVRNTQVTIRVESGIYEEDYPIKIPANVSVKGDEFRRVIVRPKNRVSQSRWANTYFYRDAVFDNLVLGKSSIEQFEVYAPYDARRAGGIYTVNRWESTASGKDAIFEITVSSTGTVTDVTLVDAGSNFVDNEIITISDKELGNTGASSIEITVTSIPNGSRYVNPLTKTVDGYFGYHYLKNPGILKNIGAGYENVGNWSVASTALIDNREFIQEQFIEYIEQEYSYIIGTYNKQQFKSEAGIIVDALINDLENGENELTLEIQGKIGNSAALNGFETEVISGITHITLLAQQIIRGIEPNVVGATLEYEFDDFNGDGDPDLWKTDTVYRLGNVVKVEIGGVSRYFTPVKEHTSGPDFDSEEVLEYWREIDGPETVISNLINTIIFAFDQEYNPPLKNNELDVFLMNDATIVRNLTVQGHGGFMCVLDPTGQVLTKSPYIQTGSSFSQSINKQSFRGGLFVDAFVGNSAVQVVEKVDGSPFRLKVQSIGDQNSPQGLYVRRPQTPCVFYIDGRRFQVNAITRYDPDFGTADLILDPSSNNGEGFAGITSELITGANLNNIGEFEFDQDIWARNSSLILSGMGYDIALGTNFNSIYNAVSYRRDIDNNVISDQLPETLSALTVGKNETLSLSSVASETDITQTLTTAWDNLLNIIENGNTVADPLVFNNYPTDNLDRAYARELIQENKALLINDTIAWLNNEYPNLTYDSVQFETDFGYALDSLSYDIQYGGNSASARNAELYLKYSISELTQEQKDAALDAYNYLDQITGQVITELYPGQYQISTPASSNEVSQVSELLQIIKNVLTNETLNSIPVIEYPKTEWVTVNKTNAQSDINSRQRVIVNKIIQSVQSPFNITLQTAGNRSILGNDFTQINDLGYGLVAANGALSEMVSMFTYYCWSSYYAKNGSEIRSLTGSSCYGEYGLVAEGADPNEIPDAIELYEDMVQPGKAFNADVILRLSEPVILRKGDVIEQANTLATAEVAVDTSLVQNSGSSTIYLINASGVFDTTNEMSVISSTSGTTIGSLGASSIPINVDNAGYSNDQESLSLYAYDMKDVPSNRSEFDVFHPERPANARYEVANVEIMNTGVGFYENVGTEIAYTFQPGVSSTGTESGAIFRIKKTINNGYDVEVRNAGQGYAVDDSFLVSGSLLGGNNTEHDCLITVTAVDDDDSSVGIGAITKALASGNIYIEETTPVYSGSVYKLNFSTGDAQYSDTGLLENVAFNTLIEYRRNQTHILSDVARPDTLTIRPSTAVIFNENPDYVYRSISFLTSNSIGTELPDNVLQAGFDSAYDYIRLIVDATKAQEPDLSGTGTTKGATSGDNVIAVLPVADTNEIYRLNSNENTPVQNRPTGWTTESLTKPNIVVWQGKKHYVYNYRGVQTINGVETEVPPAEDNEYAIVDIVDAGSDINYPSTPSGLASPVVLSNEVVTLRAGLEAGSLGDVTVNISTCRATSHDFLDIGTGGFNNSNYPTVIFGQPSEKDGSKEVSERGKGRVFYVSTDQDGIFRVGRFFSVDQGTGTVTFSASIALSDVDGLGFKRGVVVTEFSTDTAMTDNASDTVPTELAVRGYVNRRLGYDFNGNPVSNKIGPGVLAPNGSVPMTDTLNAAGNTITNIRAPITASDAATKAYADSLKDSNDELKDLRSIEYNEYEEGQFIVSTGYLKLIIDANTVVGRFVRGDELTGSVTGATGQVVDVKETTATEGNILEIIYTPRTGVFSDGKPSGNSPDPDTIVSNSGARGLVIDGPIDEWANGYWNEDSDIVITTDRIVDTDGSQILSRFTKINAQLKTNSIVNSDVNGSAGIAQSKLQLNAATTRVDSNALSQSDLGVASFDSSLFASENGWITINDGAMSLEKVEKIKPDHILGSWTGNDINTIDEVPFSTVVADGNGLEDKDFVPSSEVLGTEDSGYALIKTDEGVYGISNVSSFGEGNSLVKTNGSGSIQVNSLILGGNSDYEILSLDTTTLNLKTPAQGVVLSAVGGSGGSNPTYPTVNIPGNVGIGDASVENSTLKDTSTLANKSSLGSSWIYSSFIEAPNEKSSASSGISIGAGTGFTATGQVAVVVADSVTSSSLSPFVFSSDGVVPDTDDAYDIGSSNRKYSNVYATLFRGTATESYYADLAENYVADSKYENGTVVIFGGEQEITISTEKSSRRVAGVVSTNPAHLMNIGLEGDTVLPLALQGRVPCKVIGRVQKGDLIVTSAVAGYGMVNNDALPGTIIGKSLETKDSLERGTIEIVVGKH